MSSVLPAAPPPPGGSMAPAPPGGPGEPLGAAPSPPTPSVPGGRLAPLTRAFRAKRQQQQRMAARKPATVTVVQSEPAEARQERARQIAQLRAFMREGARGVALQNIPHTPKSAQPDPHQAAIQDVISGVKSASPYTPQTIRGRAAALARNRAASKTVPLKQYITPSGMVLDEEDVAGAPKQQGATPQARASVQGASEIAKDLRGETP